MEKFKYILANIGEAIIRFFTFIFKYIKIGYKKIKRIIKRYIRLLVRHTKAKDYSVLIYTIVSVLILILVFVLCGKALGHKKSKKKVKATTEITTEATTEDPEVAKKNKLIASAKKIYESNKDKLILVNENHELAADYSFEHHTLNCGEDVNSICYDHLVELLNACNENNCEYNIVSGYRDRDSQSAIYDETVQKIVSEGLSEDEAKQQANASVQKPGCSEHETGLAIDLTSPQTTTLDEFTKDDPTNVWLAKNSYKYGFILRYPEDKQSITGINYEPWHFRYVGKKAAKFMHKNNLCLEEFYELLNQ